MQSIGTETLKSLADRFGYRSYTRYMKRMRSYFRGISLEGKRVLDIGCGRGAAAVWAAIQGASYVLGIEPEIDGSTSGALAEFQTIVDDNGLEGIVEARNTVFQALPEDTPKFDVIVMINVINHLNEAAVISLNYDESSQRQYVETLRQIRQLSTNHGILVISDAARGNLWNQLGIPNPFAKTIDWEKHQDPRIWSQVLERAGFQVQDVSWAPHYPSYFLTGNWLFNYLTTSDFVLRAKVSSDLQ